MTHRYGVRPADRLRQHKLVGDRSVTGRSRGALFCYNPRQSFRDVRHFSLSALRQQVGSSVPRESGNSIVAETLAQPHPCPGCGKVYRIPPSPEPRNAECKVCGTKFAVPAARAAAAAPAKPAAARTTASPAKPAAARQPAAVAARAQGSSAKSASAAAPPRPPAPSPPPRREPPPAEPSLDAYGDGATEAPADDIFSDALGLGALTAADSAPAAGGLVSIDPCPGCKKPLPAGAVVCVKCGYNVKTGKKAPVAKPAAAAPVARGPGHPLDRQAAAAPAEASLLELFRTPFDPGLLAQAAIVLIVSFVFGLAANGVGYVIAATGVPALMFFGGLALLVAGLVFSGWVTKFYFAVVEQYAFARGFDPSSHSAVASLLRLIVVTVLAMFPLFVWLIIMGVNVQSRGGGAATGEEVAIVALLFVAGFLYWPMGVAVAAAYRSLNPVRVVRILAGVIGPYLLMQVYLLVLIAAVVGVWVFLLFQLGTSDLPPMVVGIVLGVYWALAGQWVIVAALAIMGTLLRMHASRHGE